MRQSVPCLENRFGRVLVFAFVFAGTGVSGCGGGDGTDSSRDAAEEEDVVDARRPDAPPRDTAVPSPDSGTTADTRIADAALDASPDGPPLGLTARPTNSTCKAFADYTKPPQKLSETGCVDPKDPRKPAPGLIAYDVASPLWSDGSDKERFMALPDGMKIHIKDCRREPETCIPVGEGGTPQDDGHWSFPVGTVLVKSFALGGRMVETRLLVRFSQNGWGGYSYEWNEQQTDATVLPEATNGVTKQVRTPQGNRNWFFPSRSECFQCHTKAAGTSLGPTTAQMNRHHTYPSGISSNQVETLASIGLFDAPLTRPLAPPLPDPADTKVAAVERARSYMYVNCAICHRPDGSFSSIDLRFGVALKDMNVCNREPERGNAGVLGALTLVPRDPSKSLISLRMKATDMNRMPQIATSVVDPLGVMLVDEWIRSVQACP